ncbi:hypothetical protein ACJX0J_041789, partial [Zea mays]
VEIDDGAEPNPSSEFDANGGAALVRGRVSSRCKSPLGEQGRVRVLLLKLDDPVPRRKPAIVFLHSSYKCKEWLRPLLKVFLSLRFDEDIGKDEIEEKK